ncbi:UNVERIFIED_ORG: hypothetical protein J2Y81_007888 [Paraburkholderia sediminicola]|nr:hypothetical protein [Paraburkholderia sediminicola]
MATPTTDERNVLKHLHYLLTFKGERKYCIEPSIKADNTNDCLFCAKSDLPPHGTTPNNLSAEGEHIRNERLITVWLVSKDSKQINDCKI